MFALRDKSTFCWFTGEVDVWGCVLKNAVDAQGMKMVYVWNVNIQGGKAGML